MAPWEWMTPKETSAPSTRWFPSHQPLVTSSGWSSMAQENLSHPCKYLFLLVPQLGRTEVKGIPKCQAAGSQFQSSNYRYEHKRVRSGYSVCGDEWGDCGRCASVGYSEVWMRTGYPYSLWECRGEKKKISRMMFIHSVNVYWIPSWQRSDLQGASDTEDLPHLPISLSTRIPVSRRISSRVELAMMAKTIFTAS